jgi:hypothetical protein
MFSAIFTSVLAMAAIVYTSFLAASYFASKTDKKIDDMIERMDYDPDCPICASEDEDV